MSLDLDLVKMIREETWDIIERYMPEKLRPTLGITQIDIDHIFEKSYTTSLEDLIAVFDRNPSMITKVGIGVETYLPIKAVMSYRIANSIYYYIDNDFENYIRELMIQKAEKISEMSKKETGIFIHPAARIDKKFVIEYGTYTVIGDKVRIGENCYIHHGVTVGSKTIDPRESGHPEIGNNVRIGGCARILGQVRVGDNVCISPYCVVTEDIPSDCMLLIVNQLQLLKHNQTNDSKKIIIYGIVPETDGILTIYGSNLENSEIDIVDYEMTVFKKINVSKIQQTTNLIKFKISLNENLQLGSISFKEKENISILIRNSSSVCITKSLGFKHALDSLLN